MTETNFKHTEIGLIPHDWEVKTLGELFIFNAGGDVQKDCYSPVKIGDKTNPIYSNSLENKGLYGYTSNPRYTANAITITGRGSLGHAEYRNHAFDAIVRLLVLSPIRDTIDCSFVTNEINFLVPFVFESTGVPQLTVPQAQSAIIPLPPTLAEQERIAGALSSIDTLIGALNEQIEKKRHIKQGTMRQLLTGKKRLEGFTGAWKSVTFEDVVERFATGLNPRQNFKLNSGGALFYVTIKDFKDGVLSFDNCDRIDEAAFELINKRADLREGDLLFSSIGRVGDAFVIKSTPTNWNINESVYNLRPNYSVIISDFLYHIIKGKELSNKIQDAVTGSTLRSIKMNHLKQISFSIPPTIAEQSAIAAVLSRMDTEIAALEQKRDKYIAIKSGMMQNLLTGKIRLV